MNKGILTTIGLTALLLFAGCDSSTSSSNGDDPTPTVFELTGSWKATDATFTHGGTELTANITSAFKGDSTFATTTEITDPGTFTSQAGGDIVSYNNEENWYICKVTTADDLTMISKFGRTDYIVADDGTSFTGTSYSYEDSEAAAKTSTTVQLSSLTMMKQ